MKKKITLPVLTPTMDDCLLVSWEKEVNDTVKEGDVLFEVESNKVVNQIESTYNGILIEKKFSVGDRVSPNEVVALLEV